MIGYNPKGKCIYSATMTVGKYYDGDHPWDDDKQIKSLSLRTVHGYMFGDKGQLEQEFETRFNLRSGAFENGWVRDENGKVKDA